MQTLDGSVRIAVATLGCRVNQYESAMMQRQLERTYTVVSENADVYVLNTCTVTALAERKVRQTMRRLRRAHPQALILLIGCLADALALGVARLDASDVTLAGNAWKPRIAEAVQAALSGERGLLESPPTSPLKSEFVSRHAGRVRAFLKIQDGCDRSCTYCRTTQVRGPSRSKDIGASVQEARGLVASGHREIVLTGINLASYAPPRGDLVALMSRLIEIPGLLRLRLGSLNPAGVNERLLEFLPHAPKVCPHFHIPLQSGDDRLLARMRRGYTASGFRHAIDRLRAARPEATFGTDVIIGYPGEDDDAFGRTVAAVEEVRFSNLHTFRYSHRAGTPAAEEDARTVPASVKRLRAQRLGAIGRSILRRHLDERIGSLQAVLAETARNGHWLGYTRDYVRVVVADAGRTRPGDEIETRIVGVRGDRLEGVMRDQQDTD